MEKDDYHKDYLKIFDMLSPIEIKVQMLSILLGSTDNAWHVIGITKEALQAISDNDFKYTSGIQRSHKVPRNKTYKEMLTNKIIDADEWWKFFIERDKTILATSSQNMKDELDDYISFENEKFLFRASGFRFRYTKEEKDFLRKISEKNLT